MQAFLDSSPLGICLFLLATVTAGESTLRYCVIMGGLILAGTAFNLNMIPHPLCLSIMAPIAIVVALLLANKVALRIKIKQSRWNLGRLIQAKVL